jgi:hypothetical protein
MFHCRGKQRFFTLRHNITPDLSLFGRQFVTNTLMGSDFSVTV